MLYKNIVIDCGCVKKIWTMYLFENMYAAGQPTLAWVRGVIQPLCYIYVLTLFSLSPKPQRIRDFVALLYLLSLAYRCWSNLTQLGFDLRRQTLNTPR